MNYPPPPQEKAETRADGKKNVLDKNKGQPNKLKIRFGMLFRRPLIKS